MLSHTAPEGLNLPEPQVDFDPLAHTIGITSQRFDRCAFSKRTVKLIPISESSLLAGLAEGHVIEQGQRYSKRTYQILAVEPQEPPPRTRAPTQGVRRARELAAAKVGGPHGEDVLLIELERELLVRRARIYGAGERGVWVRGREGRRRRCCCWGESERVPRGCRRYERLVLLSGGGGATLGGRNGCEKLCGPQNVASERVWIQITGAVASEA